MATIDRRISRFGKLYLPIIICVSIGLICASLVRLLEQDWYLSLKLPIWKPPYSIWAPMWMSLYFLMGISIGIVWRSRATSKKIRRAIRFFIIQLSLGFVWIILFFLFHSISLALAAASLLIIFIVLTIKCFYPISKKATYLMIPYLVWTLFTSSLNGYFLLLNSHYMNM